MHIVCYLTFVPVLRIRDVYPGPRPRSWFSSILNLGSTKNKKKRGKICLVLPFFSSHKFYIRHNIIFLFLTHKIVTKLSEILVWNRRSGIRKNWSRIQGSKSTGAPDPDSQTWFIPYWYHLPVCVWIIASFSCPNKDARWKECCKVGLNIIEMG